MATALPKTSFAAQVERDARRVELASASDAVVGRYIVARNHAGLFEAMKILGISGVFCDVRRGQLSTVQQRFADDTPVFIGEPAWFTNGRPVDGVASTANESYLPRIVLPSAGDRGAIFGIDGTRYVEVPAQPERCPIRQRFRLTIAQVNAGYTLLNAMQGLKYRLLDASAISVGGAAGAVTTVDILGTQGAASVKLVAFAQANLTQNTMLRAGGTGATILAGGASFITNDVNTAITVDVTGADVTTATHIDFEITYAIEL